MRVVIYEEGLTVVNLMDETSREYSIQAAAMRRKPDTQMVDQVCMSKIGHLEKNKERNTKASDD